MKAMADIQSMASFYRLFMEEVLIAEDRETSGWTTEDFLTSVMLEYTRHLSIQRARAAAECVCFF